MKYSTNTVIIGAGMAGMTAAIYLKRANIDFVIIESSAPGGQINKSSNVENYPGFESVDGPTLALNTYEQLTKLRVEITFGYVNEIYINGNKKYVKLESAEYECENIVLATGRSPKELGLENEKNLVGHGISWCAYCDGYLYKDKIVSVVGGGNSAFEEALFLSNICKKVYLIHRRDTFRASKLLQEKVFNKSNIELITNEEIKKLIVENDYLKGLALNKREVEVSGLFIYIGSVPNIDLVKNLNINLENNYIVVDKNMETNIEGIYACGDIVSKNLYQLTTAVGEGSTAASSIILKSNTR